MYVVIYDIETMLPLYTAEVNETVTKEFFEEQDLNCFLSEDGDIHQKYVEDESLTPIQEMELSFDSNEISLEESITFTDYPSGTILKIDGNNYELTEEELEFEPENQGVYELVFTNRPKYFDKKVMVTVS
jgi:hypothetical protein